MNRKLFEEAKDLYQKLDAIENEIINIEEADYIDVQIAQEGGFSHSCVSTIDTADLKDIITEELESKKKLVEQEIKEL